MSALRTAEYRGPAAGNTLTKLTTLTTPAFGRSNTAGMRGAVPDGHSRKTTGPSLWLGIRSLMWLPWLAWLALLRPVPCIFCGSLASSAPKGANCLVMCHIARICPVLSPHYPRKRRRCLLSANAASMTAVWRQNAGSSPLDFWESWWLRLSAETESEAAAGNADNKGLIVLPDCFVGIIWTQLVMARPSGRLVQLRLAPSDKGFCKDQLRALSPSLCFDVAVPIAFKWW